jgi:hypothetical protein
VLLASEVRPYDRVVAPNSLLASLNDVIVVRRCVVPHAHCLFGGNNGTVGMRRESGYLRYISLYNPCAWLVGSLGQSEYVIWTRPGPCLHQWQ